MGIGGSFPGVKRQGIEADHSLAPSAEKIRTVELYLQSLKRLHVMEFNELNRGKTLPLPLF
jgi:hypothetical protein